MDDWIEIERDEAHIKRERAKARELRKTSYFQNLFAQGICHYCKQKFPKEELTLDHPMDHLKPNPANSSPLTPLGFLERAATVYGECTSIIYNNTSFTWSHTHCRYL